MSALAIRTVEAADAAFPSRADADFVAALG